MAPRPVTTTRRRRHGFVDASLSVHVEAYSLLPATKAHLDDCNGTALLMQAIEERMVRDEVVVVVSLFKEPVVAPL